MRLTKLIILIVIMSFSKFSSAEININQVDNRGVYISAHAGGILNIDGVYYLYGENRYSGNDAGVSLYSSKDMQTWKYNGIIFRQSEIKYLKGKEYFLERPKIIYNEKNDNYVMWFHVEQKKNNYNSALAGVAVSKDVSGPYKFKFAFRPNENKYAMNGNIIGSAKANLFYKHNIATGQMVRDLNVFKDSNKKAYLVYASENNATIQIAEMNNDYTSLTGHYIRVQPGKYNEAPILFKKSGKYFLIVSGTTGWKPNGASLYISNKLFGVWGYHKSPVLSENINDIKNTFNSQGANIFIFNGKWYFIADQWNTKDLKMSGYVIKEIRWNKFNIPSISSFSS